MSNLSIYFSFFVNTISSKKFFGGNCVYKKNKKQIKYNFILLLNFHGLGSIAEGFFTWLCTYVFSFEEEE